MKLILFLLVTGITAIGLFIVLTALFKNVLVPYGKRLRAPVEQINQMRDAQKALSLAVADLLVTIESDPTLVEQIGRDKLVAVYTANSNLPSSLTSR